MTNISDTFMGSLMWIDGSSLYSLITERLPTGNK